MVLMVVGCHDLLCVPSLASDAERSAAVAKALSCRSFIYSAYVPAVILAGTLEDVCLEAGVVTRKNEDEFRETAFIRGSESALEWWHDYFKELDGQEIVREHISARLCFTTAYNDWLSGE